MDDKIKALKQEIARLKSQLPAHSISPAMLMRLEELEDELEEALQNSPAGLAGEDESPS